MIKYPTFVLFVLFISSLLFQSAFAQSGEVTFEDEVMIRKILVSSEHPSPLSSSLYLKSDPEMPVMAITEWFSFTIDNTTLKSSASVWVLEDITERTMQNGGTEKTLLLRPELEEFSSLRVALIVQHVPGTIYFRERIELRSVDDTKFALNYRDGAVHMPFANSRLAAAGDAIEVTELRIASWNQSLLETDHKSAPDPKAYEEDWREGRNLEENYMYHPVWNNFAVVAAERISVKGPFVIIPALNEALGCWIAYEHGSPDDDPEQDYIRIDAEQVDNGLEVCFTTQSGAYYEDELISNSTPFSTVWYAYEFFEKEESLSTAHSHIWHYLNGKILENTYSRKPFFYYNTWGMQRDESYKGNDVRGILTEQKIEEEIALAAESGVDLFVLDDGWQDDFGDWNPHSERLPNGLGFYIDACRERNLVPGIWLATLAVGPESALAAEHSDWLIRDEMDNPIIGRWDKNVACFNSDYKDYFISKCKELIDQGILYFKWDGIDKHLCDSDLHHHGDESVANEQRRQRQGYSIPLEVADAIKQLKEYEPRIIVEVDVTEEDRSVGLAILSEARYFWMNNGASWYGDYTTYRAKSMRMITNLFGRILPPTLQTYANFPLNDPTYQAQQYNVYSSLIGGRGIWGNIATMTAAERERVKEMITMVKQVDESTADIIPVITGSVGDSPEIYEYVDREEATGKIIAFSGSACKHDYTVNELSMADVLGVLNHSYYSDEASLTLNLEFYMPEDCKAAVILPNNGTGVSIAASTSWLKEIELTEGALRFVNGDTGEHTVLVTGSDTVPVVKSDVTVEAVIDEIDENVYKIVITTVEADTEVHIIK